MSKKSGVLLLVCSTVSLEYVMEVAWGSFQQHCLPILPWALVASLEYHAFGLPKLSALGLPMLPLHRFGDLPPHWLRVRLLVNNFRLVFVNVGHCPSFHS